jgi:glycosyltransferase involved in cell wall biosynthesis
MRFFNWLFRRPKPEDFYSLSLIFPFRRGDDMTRDRVFDKVLEYYTWNLPEAEIIEVSDPLNAYPFNKSAAINHGVRQSHGDVIAIIDADCYIDTETIRDVAEEIYDALDNGERRWYIPYTRFYRLNQHITKTILPVLEDRFIVRHLGDPPPKYDLDPSPANHSTGHYFGAMIQIMPREAFDLVDGWDVIFDGWGSEDVSMLYSLDTLYAPHDLWFGPVYHLWHHINLGPNPFIREWLGQEKKEPEERHHWKLAKAYRDANGDSEAMQALVDKSLVMEEERNEHLLVVKTNGLSD